MSENVNLKEALFAGTKFAQSKEWTYSRTNPDDPMWTRSDGAKYPTEAIVRQGAKPVHAIYQSRRDELLHKEKHLPEVLTLAKAWDRVTKHRAFESCFDEDKPLIEAVFDRLDGLLSTEQSVTELAPTQQPVTLTALMAAWDSAEDGLPRKGDVVIEGYDNTGKGDMPDGTAFHVFRAEADFPLFAESRFRRILTRAPEPEPTNAELLKADLDKWTGDIEQCVKLGLVEYLDDQGWVKAPEATDE